MMYESKMREFNRRETDVLAAWGVYAMTVAGLAVCSLFALFA